MNQINTINHPQERMGMDTIGGFEALQRCAKLLSCSTIVPKIYQGDTGFPNAVVALNMAMRMGADPMMVMQNMYIVYGNPSWSSKFKVAAFNQCGRFQAIRYEFKSKEGSDDWGCRAWTVEFASGERISGPWVTIAIAKKEGWFDKKGSKWETIPEQMLRYRAASWMIDTTAPELLMGLKTDDEVIDAEIVSSKIEPSDEVIFDSPPLESLEPEGPKEWTEQELELFEMLISRLKASYKLGGKEDKWPDTEAKQRARMNVDPAGNVIAELNGMLPKQK